ncbi:helix-turn-helix transcriptional regulator [Halogeometricum borinquense]|uniref:Helix-turn-helix transcriptional regulator n=1 Tax=Halogeometricum borinquense TaxID=60847 RepID=A0A6C0UL63_9EURY|nr:helix-turn-helix domain-containing protein [Halogeometricum borinquense]QIB75997.1 helix-turn-helix transcriptional regulator [Halogeometricum borinquense]
MSVPTDDSGADETLSEEERRVVDSISNLGSQWRLLVLYDLQNSEKRFNELKRSTGASSRTLSRVLDDLQEMGHVERRLEEDAPVATYYSLTAKGESLCPVFDELEKWSKKWEADSAADVNSSE